MSAINLQIVEKSFRSKNQKQFAESLKFKDYQVLEFSEEPVKKFNCEDAKPTHCGGLPGCEDLSCEDYCAKANDTGCNPFTLDIPTKKCCECGLCGNVPGKQYMQYKSIVSARHW